MWKKISVCMFMKNFVLIDQLKLMQIKFTPTSVNFSIFCFGKPVKKIRLSKT